MAGTDRLTELAGALDHRLDLPEGPVVVAVSGGADSAALLWLAVRRGLDVTAVHVFHGLPASSLMSTAAGQIAAFCGVRLQMAFVQPEGSSEHHLRDVRLAALVAHSGANPILLGHTADDQAETVLMRILRGTGPEGLAGIAPRRGQLHHPMLQVTRAEARELAGLAGLPFRDDPANEDETILRNRVRLDLLPAMERAIGRPPREALVRLADQAARESTVLESVAASIPAQSRNGAVRFPTGSLVAAGDVAAARAIRAAVAHVGNGYPPDRAAVDRILDVVHGRSSATEIEPGLRAEVSGPHLVLTGPGDVIEDDPPTRLGEGATAWSGWRFRSERMEGPLVQPLSAARFVVPVDDEALEVRAVRPGDRVTGRQAHAALADAGVAADRRRTWPIVTRGDHPVWLPWVRARVWPTHRPGRYLCLVAVREPKWQTFEL
ncbi:MAG: tRNA lysidine(34) synthetase TilS [Acidimicrobiia bacterium]